MPELRAAALAAWRAAEPDVKCAALAALAADRDGLAIDTARTFAEPAAAPGRPARPILVAPEHVAARKVGAPAGRVALLHAIAHIEFNAINLALDAVWRFAGLPSNYYRDWLGVAAEEATHYQLLAERLRAAGAGYGDLPAHDGLWELTWATRADVLARMALVPRLLEARGLDASPAVRQRLVAAGDLASAAVIGRILHDEIGHVAIGNRWFHWLCGQRGLEPLATAHALALAHRAPAPRGPFNWSARRAAGFSDTELAALGRGDRPGKSPSARGPVATAPVAAAPAAAGPASAGASSGRSQGTPASGGALAGSRHALPASTGAVPASTEAGSAASAAGVPSIGTAPAAIGAPLAAGVAAVPPVPRSWP